MKKLLISIAIIPIICLSLCNNILAETVYTEGTLNYVIRNGTIVITKYFGRESSVTVPSSINNLPVIEIASGAFVDTNAKDVIIPDTVINIAADSMDSNVKYEIVDEAAVIKDNYIQEETKDTTDSDSKENIDISETVDIDEPESNIDDGKEVVVIEDEIVETGDVDPDAIEDIEIKEDSNNIVNNDNNSLFIVVIGGLIIGVIVYCIKKKRH